MKDLAKHMNRARIVPRRDAPVRTVEPTARRLDSWPVEEVTPHAATLTMTEGPPMDRPKMGRPAHSAEQRRDYRFTSYFDYEEARRLEQYASKRRLSRSDALRELTLLGLEYLRKSGQSR